MFKDGYSKRKEETRWELTIKSKLEYLMCPVKNSLGGKP